MAGVLSFTRTWNVHIETKQQPESGVFPSPYELCQRNKTSREMRWGAGRITVVCYKAMLQPLFCWTAVSAVTQSRRYVQSCGVFAAFPFLYHLVDVRLRKITCSRVYKFCISKSECVLSVGFGFPHADNPATNTAVQAQGLCCHSRAVQRCATCCVQQGTFVMSTLCVVLLRFIF